VFTKQIVDFVVEYKGLFTQEQESFERVSFWLSMERTFHCGGYWFLSFIV